MIKKYEEFEELIKKISKMQHVIAVLHWDMETYMPPRGGDARANQIALLSGMVHEAQQDPRLYDLITELSAADDLSPEQATNVREMKRELDRERKLSKELVVELNRTSVKAHEVWVQAREQANYELFKPWLQKLVDLNLQKIDQIGYEDEPYNALLDEYEPGMKAARVEELFTPLKTTLPSLVQQIVDAPVKPDVSIMTRFYRAEQQESFLKMLMQDMGFDFEAGRMDRAVHPFCTSFTPNDVRITTRYDEHMLGEALLATAHETGHALYEQGLPAAYAGTPMGQAASFGLHESQSLFWEKVVVASRPFWEQYYPRLQAVFKEQLSAVSLDDFYLALNRVQPSFIRVGSDEVTYCLHIVLRFELERALFAKEISVDDLKGLWHEKMETYLGLTVPDDSKGILQDTHWASGLFGYFPSYALGHMYAAQLRLALRQALPDFDANLSAGNLLPIKEWLNENIHQHGMRYRAEELLERISGNRLSVQPYLNYLTEKYHDLYQIEI